MKSFPVFHLLHVLIFVLSSDNNEYSCDHYISAVESNLYVDRAKRIWYLSHMRAANVQASLRNRAVSPEPRCSLIHPVSQELPSDRKPDRICAVKSCHDGMYQIRLTRWTNRKIVTGVLTNEPRQANLCLRAFRHDHFNCACPAIRGQGSGFLSEGSSWTLVWASSEGSGETARMRRLAWTFVARIGDKYQIRLTRSKYKPSVPFLGHRQTVQTQLRRRILFRKGLCQQVL